MTIRKVYRQGNPRGQRPEGSDSADFKKTIESGRLRKTWVSKDDLKLAVREALDHAKATKQRTGWVRGDTATNLETLEELNAVRKQNAEYRDAMGNLEIELALPPIPQANGEVEIKLFPLSTTPSGNIITSGTYACLRATWISAFPIFYSNLKWESNAWGGQTAYTVNEYDSRVAIGSGFAGELAPFDTSGLFQISKATFDRLTSYYIEVGLMATEGEQPFTEEAKRLVRRHHISNVAGRGFVVTAGEVNRVSVEKPNRSDFDDEIPF